MSSLNFVLVLLSVGMVCAGQLMFKLVGFRLGQGMLVWDPRVLGIALVSFALYGLATLLWIYILRSTPITKAYPYMALSFVIVPIGGVWLFSESIKPLYIAGIALIVAGIFLTALAGGSSSSGEVTQSESANPR